MARKILQTVKGEKAIPGGWELTLDFRLAEGTPIPAILQLPGGGAPVPGALLLHGFSSRKEVLSETVGRALLLRGIASLAIDLPLHGTRHDPIASQALRNPLKALGHWKSALAEARLAIRYLEVRDEIERARVAVVGYSLGSQIAVALAAGAPAVRAVVVAAGGDLPDSSPMTAIARGVADPIRAVRGLAGRPLLMIHGRHDRTVTPAQAQRLFDAAGEPKEIRWYDAGHRLPEEAIAGAVGWLAERLEGIG